MPFNTSYCQMISGSAAVLIYFRPCTGSFLIPSILIYLICADCSACPYLSIPHNPEFRKIIHALSHPTSTAVIHPGIFFCLSTAFPARDNIRRATVPLFKACSVRIMGRQYHYPPTTVLPRKAVRYLFLFFFLKSPCISHKDNRRKQQRETDIQCSSRLA